MAAALFNAIIQIQRRAHLGKTPVSIRKDLRFKVGVSS